MPFPIRPENLPCTSSSREAVWFGSGWATDGSTWVRSTTTSEKSPPYTENFGIEGVRNDDVRNVGPTDIPERPDLIWASFPCVDVSIAGSRDGLDGSSSGAFWPCWRTIRQLVDQGTGTSRDCSGECERVDFVPRRQGLRRCDRCSFIPRATASERSSSMQHFSCRRVGSAFSSLRSTPEFPFRPG